MTTNIQIIINGEELPLGTTSSGESIYHSFNLDQEDNYIPALIKKSVSTVSLLLEICGSCKSCGSCNFDDNFLNNLVDGATINIKITGKGNPLSTEYFNLKQNSENLFTIPLSKEINGFVSLSKGKTNANSKAKLLVNFLQGF